MRRRVPGATDISDNILLPIMKENLTESSFKGSVVVNYNFVMTKTIELNGEYRWKFLDQKILSFCEGIAFDRQHYLFSSFNEKMKQLATGGFINHWLEKFTKHRYIVEKIPPDDLIVLDVERLSIGFQIWLIMLGISTVAFIGEMVHYWGPKLYKMIIFYFILRGLQKYSRPHQ